MNCVDIADAVTAELNDGGFSLPFTAQRLLLPDFELSQLADMKVSVVPKAVEFNAFSRQHTQYEFSVDVGIQQKLDGDVETLLPGLLSFVDEMVTFLRKRKLTSVPEAVWLRSVNDPIYSREHLVNQRTFTSILTVTYKAVK